MKLDQTPLGTFDVFKDVNTWDNATAHNWKKALNLRAATPDQKILRQKIVKLASLREGDLAVEIGCGTGALLSDLASVVGVNGQVIGFEPQTILAREAQKQVAAQGFSKIVKVTESLGDELPIDSQIANACLAQTVLIHLPDAILRRTLAEMVRITKMNGRIVSCDQDGDTWTIDHPDREMTRRVIQFNSDQRYADGWTGRSLRRLFSEAGLGDITVDTAVHTDHQKDSYLFGMAERIAGAAVKAGAIPFNEMDRWLAKLNKLGNEGKFFSSINYFLASGIRN